MAKKLYRISRAAACRRSAQCLGTSEGRGRAAARGAQRILGATSDSESTRTIAEKTGHVPSRLGLGFAARDWAPFSHEKTPSLDDLGWV